jgi:hypothetical protein
VQLLQRTLGATSQTTLGSAVGLEDPVADKLWRELWNSSVGLDRGAASGVDLDAHGPDGRRVVGHRQRSQSGWAGWWSRMAAIATSGAEADRGSAAGTRGYTSGEEDDDDEAGYCERWEDMVSEVNLFFEWCVVNRLNKVEWLLLGELSYARVSLFCIVPSLLAAPVLTLVLQVTTNGTTTSTRGSTGWLYWCRLDTSTASWWEETPPWATSSSTVGL